LTETEVQQRVGFRYRIIENLHDLFLKKRKRQLAEKYNESLEVMEKDMGKLDKQVFKLTSGDLRIAKRRDGKV